jgi:hypothetical protein
MYSLRGENFISPRYFPRSPRLWYLTFFPISPQQKWCFGRWPGLVLELPKLLAVTRIFFFMVYHQNYHNCSTLVLTVYYRFRWLADYIFLKWFFECFFGNWTVAPCTRTHALTDILVNRSSNFQVVWLAHCQHSWILSSDPGFESQPVSKVHTQVRIAANSGNIIGRKSHHKHVVVHSLTRFAARWR